jgi:Na+-transporting NADH:ubiquinone oxidoreductase subunit NqrD
MRTTARRAVLGLLNLLAVKSTFISALVTTLAPKLVNSISQVHSPFSLLDHSLPPTD